MRFFGDQFLAFPDDADEVLQLTSSEIDEQNSFVAMFDESYPTHECSPFLHTPAPAHRSLPVCRPLPRECIKRSARLIPRICFNLGDSRQSALLMISLFEDSSPGGRI